jgi:hypothetical protein
MNKTVIQCEACKKHVWEVEGKLYKIELGSSLGLREHKHKGLDNDDLKDIEAEQETRRSLKL